MPKLTYIYLDYAAATPMDPAVAKVMEPYLSQQFHNPSATYLAGRSARAALEKSRAAVARIFGVRPAEIVFTAGATEANNLAVTGVAKRFPKTEILASSIEHDSVLVPARELNAKMLPVSKHGIIDLENLRKKISNKTVLVSVMLVNNELGSIQPIRQISELIKAERLKRAANNNKLPIYLHTDATQAANWLDLHVSRLGADLMSINGGKIYGPKQTGVLFVKAGVGLVPLIMGGGQEFGVRSGTENVAGCVGLSKALEISQLCRVEEAKRVSELRELFITGLQKSLPQVVINGSPKTSAPHIVSATFPGADNERLMMELDEAGVQAAVGSACSASSDEPSHVLRAIGLDEATAQSTLRFSFGRATTKANISKTVSLLKKFADNE